MRLKEGVKLNGIRPELQIGLMVCDSVYRQRGLELVITSCADGSHKAESLHYKGLAADLRLPSRSGEGVPFAADAKAEDAATVAAIRDGVGPDFDVVLERDHIHLEWNQEQ